MNIGIDLGTTNSALAYIDPARGRGSRLPADPHSRDPAACSAGRDRSRGARCRRFCISSDDQPVVGVYAREQGALVPTRSVHSAKSWLSNPDVDRTAKILPWDSQEAAASFRRSRSPRAICAICARHWESAKRHPLAGQTSCSPFPPPSTKKRAS